MATISCTFAPLSAMSPDASAIQAALISDIEAGISKNRYSTGLKKQYENQLQHIRSGAPSCEVLGFPGFKSLLST